MDEQHRHIVLWRDQNQHSIDNGQSNWFQNVAQVIYNLPPPSVRIHAMPMPIANVTREIAM